MLDQMAVINQIISGNKSISISVLYNQLRHQLSSKERARLQFTLLTTLQVLFGIMYQRMESIDNNDWKK